MTPTETLAKAQRDNSQGKKHKLSKITLFYLSNNDRTCQLHHVDNIILSIKLMKKKRTNVTESSPWTVRQMLSHIAGGIVN